MQQNTFLLVSLGCAKNTVDSESMATLLLRSGFQSVSQPDEAEFLIVNTCGFIHDARQESYKVLGELARNKMKGQRLIAAGCLPERVREKLVSEVSGLDGVISTRRWMDIVPFIRHMNRQTKRLSGSPYYHFSAFASPVDEEPSIPRIAIQGGSAYLKIADGCRRQCAFCSIPLIKGNLESRPTDAILKDVLFLRDRGIQEIILIAQDSTDYGRDRGITNGLGPLLKRITDQAPEVPWIRILYTFPGSIDDHLIEVMASTPQIVHYLDIPLQHSHPSVLNDMRRPANTDWVYKTLEKFKTLIPDIAIRTTFILGYPGETEKEFTHLLNFVKEMQFDHVGAFLFSPETGTASEPLGDPVSPQVKEERLERLMEIQQPISLTKNQSFIGKTLPILIEGKDENISVGRSYRDAPEVDGLVIVYGEAPVGQIIDVKITEALAYDLAGFPVTNA